MTRARLWLLAVLMGPACIAACSEGSNGNGPDNDGGSDATSDGPDGSQDGTAEGATDGAGDARDTGPEGGLDAGPDAAPEAGPSDGSSEAAHDGASDAANDVVSPPTPVVLVSDAPNATLLATDGTSVYWIDSLPNDAGVASPDAGEGGVPAGPIGRVMKVATTGSSEVALATTPGAVPQRFAIDDTNVYWIDNHGAVSVVPKDGSRAASTLVASGASAAITANGGEVYYGVSSNGVDRIGLDGGAPQPLATSVSPLDLVVVAGNVYWATTAGTLQYVSASAGGSPTTLVAPDPDAGTGEFVSTTNIQNLTTDGTSLYWNRAPSGPYPGAIMAVALGGSAPQVVTNTASLAPFSVAFGGTNLYYLLPSPALLRVSSNAGTPAILTSTDVGGATHITGSPGPTVAVDATNVYWLNPPQIVKITR